jgi:hypothetical protein
VKKIISIAFYLLACVFGARAQGMFFSGLAQSVSTIPGSAQGVSNVFVPIPNATIYVCTGTYGSTACTSSSGNLASVYSCQSLSGCSITQPVLGDQYGNFDFWAKPGTYYYTVTGQVSGSSVTGSYQIVLPVVTSSGTVTPLVDLNNNYLISTTLPTAGFPTVPEVNNNLFWGTNAGQNLGNWTPVVTAGQAASGSTTLTVASATGIYGFMHVSGAGIAPGTTVVGISGTTVTLSNPTTAAVNGNVSFTPGTTEGSIGIGTGALQSMVAGNGMVAVGIDAFQNYVTDNTGGEDGNSVAIGPFAGLGETGANCQYGVLFESTFIGNKVGDNFGAGTGTCGATDSVEIGNHIYNISAPQHSTLIGGEVGTAVSGVLINTNAVTAIGGSNFNPEINGNGTVPPGYYNASSEQILGNSSAQNAYNTHDINVFGTGSLDDVGATAPSTFYEITVIGDHIADNLDSGEDDICNGGEDYLHSVATCNSLKSGNGNDVTGFGALGQATSVDYSTVDGFSAANFDQTNQITAFGAFSCYLTTGASNLCLGHYAGYNLTSGSFNVIVGTNTNTSGAGPAGNFSNDTETGAFVGMGDNSSQDSYYGERAGRRNVASLGNNSAFGFNEFFANTLATGTEQYDSFFGIDSNCDGCTNAVSLGYEADIGAVAGAVQIGTGTNNTANSMQFQGWNFLLSSGASSFTTTTLTGATPIVASGSLGLGATVATTANAGSATLPSAPAEFLEVNIGGTMYKIPLYPN